MLGEKVRAEQKSLGLSLLMISCYYYSVLDADLFLTMTILNSINPPQCIQMAALNVLSLVVFCVISA